jgi:hypothetical protein
MQHQLKIGTKESKRVATALKRKKQHLKILPKIPILNPALPLHPALIVIRAIPHLIPIQATKPVAKPALHSNSHLISLALHLNRSDSIIKLLILEQ